MFSYLLRVSRTQGALLVLASELESEGAQLSI